MINRQLVIASIFLLTFNSSSVFSQDGQRSKLRIACNVMQDQKTDDYEIYVMNIDGTGFKNITNHKDVAWTYYSWKNRLYFVSDRDACKRCYFLYSMDSDGNNVKKVSNLQLEDSWMGSRNNGKEMVVSGRVDKTIRYQLYLVDIQTGKYKQLTNEPIAAFRDPVFSPDGKRIAYVFKKNRLDRGEGEELYVMNANGSGQTKLTTYPPDDKSAEPGSYRAGPPHWNKKRGYITYQSVQNGRSSIFAVTPDGKKQWKLTENKFSEGWHDWSPDGNWLAIDVVDEASGRFDIYLMNFETKETKKLTGGSTFKYHQSPVFVETR